MGPPQITARRAATRSAEPRPRDRQARGRPRRGMSIALAVPPGSALSRAELASQFGVSSTPIRDALMRLEEEGLVDVFPQHATGVSAIDLRPAPPGPFLPRPV